MELASFTAATHLGWNLHWTFHYNTKVSFLVHHHQFRPHECMCEIRIIIHFPNLSFVYFELHLPFCHPFTQFKGVLLELFTMHFCFNDLEHFSIITNLLISKPHTTKISSLEPHYGVSGELGRTRTYMPFWGIWCLFVHFIKFSFSCVLQDIETIHHLMGVGGIEASQEKSPSPNCENTRQCPQSASRGSDKTACLFFAVFEQQRGLAVSLSLTCCLIHFQLKKWDLWALLQLFFYTFEYSFTLLYTPKQNSIY